MSGTRLAALQVGGSSGPWAALGFDVDVDGSIPLRNGALEFGRDEPGMLGLSVAGLEHPLVDIEGIGVTSGQPVPPLDHPNGAFEIDHVVLITNSLDRTSEAVEAALGLPLRRVRETDTVRQGFHRFADHQGTRGCIIEIVENQRVQRTSLFGLVVNVVDLDAVCQRWGADAIGEPKPAVQPGRRIATVRRQAGLGVPVALMTPES